MRSLSFHGVESSLVYVVLMVDVCSNMYMTLCTQKFTIHKYNDSHVHQLTCAMINMYTSIYNSKPKLTSSFFYRKIKLQSYAQDLFVFMI